jgi:hypothetical protein
MKKDQSKSIQLLKNSANNNKEDKKGENSNEVLRRLRIQNKKLLQEVLNLKNQLKETRSENKQMKKHLDDWVNLKKLILQSAWKY